MAEGALRGRIVSEAGVVVLGVYGVFARRGERTDELTDRLEMVEVSEEVDGLLCRVMVGWCRGGRDDRAAFRSRLRRALREAAKDEFAGEEAEEAVERVRGSSEAVRRAVARFVAVMMGEAAGLLATRPAEKGGREESRDEAVEAVGLVDVLFRASDTASEDRARRGGLVEVCGGFGGRLVEPGEVEDREDVEGRCGVLAVVLALVVLDRTMATAVSETVDFQAPLTGTFSTECSGLCQPTALAQKSQDPAHPNSTCVYVLGVFLASYFSVFLVYFAVFSM